MAKTLVYKVMKAAVLLYLPLLAGCQPINSPTPTPAPTLAPTPALTELSPPVIDGTISPGEWEDARVEAFFEGSELLLMEREAGWYVGIRADTTEMIVVNLFINRGNEIDILHSSAALGTATYHKEGEEWLLFRDFTWWCRDTSESPEALAERETFYLLEHWVSTNTYIGSLNEAEFQIEKREDSLRIAVTFMIVPGNSVTYWPASLTDATSRPLDELPERMDFSPEEWGVLGSEE